jgi:hypothetical protein
LLLSNAATADDLTVASPDTPRKDAPLSITADQIEGAQDKQVEATGQVEQITCCTTAIPTKPTPRAMCACNSRG